MWKTKLGLGTNEQFGKSIPEQIEIFKNVGFDAFFTGWSKESDIKEWKKQADNLGIIYQSIHSPFDKAADFWETGRKAEKAIDEQIECIHDCAENNIPIMVVHAFIGFEKHSPNDIGVKNFEKVVLEAQKAGIKIAFENTEGEEYLAALMNNLSHYENVGFCWDTGHELCYNYGKDLMAKYGEKLIATHFNDNLGIKDFNGKITWIDDLHLLPFDGVADWNIIMQRIANYDYDDILTFELNTLSKPGRHENDIYKNMPIELYITEAYKRACRVAALRYLYK